jgi:hypothetical protein
MPTLEDTAIDFPVTTLNDLLEVEAKAGVTVGADEDKYRRWAFLSTGAAGLLAIILAVVLITGGGDDGGGSESKAQTAQKPTGWSEVSLTNVADGRIPDPKAGNFYKVTSREDGNVLANAAMLTSFKAGAKFGSVQQFNVVLAVKPEEEKGLITADQKALNFSPVAAPAPGQSAETTTTTAAPAAQSPTAPTPEAPVPEAPATTQPAG